MSRNKKISLILLLILFISLPLFVILIKQNQDNRSSAAVADKLEAESGVLNGNISKQIDMNASGGEYIKLNTNATSTLNTYGPGIDMDSKNNQQIGTSNNYKYAIKFKSTQSSQATAFRLQWRTGPIYSGLSGKYGIIRVSMRNDDGNGKPSNTVLSSVDVNPNNLENITYDTSLIRTINFPTPPILNSGISYHLVLENVDPNPSTSYISINSIFTYSNDLSVLGRFTPHFKNEDYQILKSINGGAWSTMNNDSPALDIIYANGGHDGLGVQSLAYSSSYPFPLIGGSNMVRERFTVQGGNKKVTKLWARIGRISGSANAILSLENSDGTVIEEGPAQGSGNIPIIPQNNIESSKGNWVSYTLSQPRTINDGQTYNLKVSAPFGTIFQHSCILSQDSSSLNGIHDMKSYAFNEGHGEKSLDGGKNWDYCYGNWYHNSTQTVMEILE